MVEGNRISAAKVVRITPEIEYSDIDRTKDLTTTPPPTENNNPKFAEIYGNSPKRFPKYIKVRNTVGKYPINIKDLKDMKIKNNNNRRKTQLEPIGRINESRRSIRSEGSCTPTKSKKKQFTFFQEETREYLQQLANKEDMKLSKCLSLETPKSSKPQGSSFFLPESKKPQILPRKPNCCERFLHYTCGYKYKEGKRDSSLSSGTRSSNLNMIFPTGTKNRFGHLEGEEKKESIREFWRNSIRKVIYIMRTVDIFKLLNKDSQDKREKNERHMGSCLIMPGSRFRMCWDMISIVLLLYISIMTPFYVAYLDQIPATITNLETLISVLFVADIILNFFTPYLSHNILVFSHKQIAINYLRTWFMLDIIASIPFHLIHLGDQDKNNSGLTERVPRMLTMLKLFKLGRLLQFITVFMDKIALRYKIKPDSSRRMGYCVGVLFVVHIFTCAWYLQARMSGFTPDTWVMRYNYYDQPIFYKYFVSCFWVCQTLTTVVYGDYQPVTFYERMLCFVLMIFGVAFYSSLFSNMSEREKNLRYKILTLANLARQTKLPPELIAKIRSNIELKYEDEYGPHMVLYRQLLEDLSSNLRSELIKFIYRNLIRTIRFFSDKPPEFLWKIIPKLKRMSYEKGDVIYSPGNPADEIYFIKKGIILLETSKLEKITAFAPGSYFGDNEVLSSTPGLARDTLARAQEDSELLYIDKSTFLQALLEFPPVEQEVFKTHKIRELRQRHISSSPMHSLGYESPKRFRSSFNRRRDSNNSSSSNSSSRESSSGSNNKSSSSSSDNEINNKKVLNLQKMNTDNQLSKGTINDATSSQGKLIPTLQIIPQQENEQLAREANLILNSTPPLNPIITPRLFLPPLQQFIITDEKEHELIKFNEPVQMLEDVSNSFIHPLENIKKINTSVMSEIVVLDTSPRESKNLQKRVDIDARKLSVVSSINQSDIEGFSKMASIEQTHLSGTRPRNLQPRMSKVMEMNFLDMDEEIRTNRSLIEKINLNSEENSKNDRHFDDMSPIEKRRLKKKESRQLKNKESKQENRNKKQLAKSKSRDLPLPIIELSTPTLDSRNEILQIPTEIRDNRRKTMKITKRSQFIPTRSVKNLHELDSPSDHGVVMKADKKSLFGNKRSVRNLLPIGEPTNRGGITMLTKDLIAININSRNKNTRVFLRDLKLELKDAIEIIFSAILDKTEEIHALLLQDKNEQIILYSYNLDYLLYIFSLIFSLLYYIQIIIISNPNQSTSKVISL